MNPEDDKDEVGVNETASIPRGAMALPACYEEEVRIAGWVKTTLIDYPGKIASTLFLEGCNFRCPYCHNPELVSPLARNASALYDPEEILAYFCTFSRLLEGVCISGGEPLLQAGLAAFCRQAARLGLKLKLDTNGSLPERLEPLLRENLLDYVAVDVKGPPGRLRGIARSALDEAHLVRSVETTVEMLKRSGVPFELRTTVVPGLLEEDDLDRLAAWMRGAPRLVLQQFRPGKTLDPVYQGVLPFPPQVLRELASRLAGQFGECVVRGVGDPVPPARAPQPHPG